MRTSELKRIAERDAEEYELYVRRCEDSYQEPLDIFAWVAMEQETAEEYQNEYRRIDYERE